MQLLTSDVWEVEYLEYALVLGHLPAKASTGWPIGGSGMLCEGHMNSEEDRAPSGPKIRHELLALEEVEEDAYDRGSSYMSEANEWT